MDHVFSRSLLALTMFVLLACVPLRGPGLVFEAHGWVEGGDADYRQGIRVQVGSVSYAEVEEQDSGALSTLTNLNPEILRIDQGEDGRYRFHARAVGEAEVRLQNPCPDLGAPCDGFFTVTIVEAEGARWMEDFVAVRGGRATAAVGFEYQDEYLSASRAFTSSDGDVDHAAQTLSFDTPLSDEPFSVEIITFGGSYLPLAVTTISPEEVRRLDVQCTHDACDLRVMVAGEVTVKGAPIVWTYEGEVLPQPPGSDGLHLARIADSSERCELCAEVEGTEIQDCYSVLCGPVEVLP